MGISKDWPRFAGELPFKVMHISELLYELVSGGKIKFKKPIKSKVTYHDPCHLGREMGIYAEPRAVLKAIPGIDLVEMYPTEHAAACCGAGGGVYQFLMSYEKLSFPEAVHDLAERANIPLPTENSERRPAEEGYSKMDLVGVMAAGAVHDLLRWAWQVVPGIYDLELAEVSVGFRPGSQDNRPAIGSAGVEGLYAAVGHGRQGVLLAPATAHYLAEAILSGSPPPELAPFAVDRFREDAEVFQS